MMIYRPKGKAAEYADWALNIYSGCTHRCRYCYAPLVLRMNRARFHSEGKPRKDFIRKLESEVSRLDVPDNCQVLLSFTSDPYQPAEKTELVTRETIQILHDAGFFVCVLTKAPTLAYRDIDLYMKGDAFATTLTFPSDRFEESVQWEPLAELPHQRIMGLKAFKAAGVETWVSLEPVLDVDAVFEVVHETHQFVDLYKVGKLNYMENNIDWGVFARDVTNMLDGLGKKYYVKEGLREYLDER